MPAGRAESEEPARHLQRRGRNVHALQGAAPVRSDSTGVASDRHPSPRVHRIRRVAWHCGRAYAIPSTRRRRPPGDARPRLARRPLERQETLAFLQWPCVNAVRHACAIDDAPAQRTCTRPGQRKLNQCRRWSGIGRAPRSGGSAWPPRRVALAIGRRVADSRVAEDCAENVWGRMVLALRRPGVSTGRNRDAGQV